MAAAAGTVDVELDLATGQRSTRGRGTIAALLELLPEAEAALVVNNGAAALVLATTALAAGREVVVSRGEMVEIGDGFRLPDLIASAGARLREVGTTNRTTLADYEAAIGPDTGCILKVHPSNFRVEGFTSAVPVAALAALGQPVVHDIGSGLLRPHRLLPDEPDAARSLADGAAVVTCSGDKLLGGPQAGLVLGRADTVTRLRRHPLARAVRADKTTLAALEATLRGPRAPVWDALEADPAGSATRCDAVVAEPAPGTRRPWSPPTASSAAVARRASRCPGGRSPSPSRMPRRCASPTDPVLARVERGRCLVDLRCIPTRTRMRWWHRRSATSPAVAGERAMAVVATAGHVDHGKSTLVRLLTGQEPDRWAEERRRGLTIDLGYAWTDIDGRRVSLVDVPGHEHFTGNMLAGLGSGRGGDVRRRGGRRVVRAVAGARPRRRRAGHRARPARRDPVRPDRRCAGRASQSLERLASLGVPVGETVLVSGATGERAARPARGARPARARAATATPRSHPSRPTDRRARSDRAGAALGGPVVHHPGRRDGGDRHPAARADRGRRRAAAATARRSGCAGCRPAVRTWTAVAGPARVAVNLRGVEVAAGRSRARRSWMAAGRLMRHRGRRRPERVPGSRTARGNRCATTASA